MAGRRKKRRLIFILVMVIMLLAAVGGLLAFKYVFKITNVEIEGSDKYTYDELYEYVFEDCNRENTILFNMNRKKTGSPQIPFIAKTDIKIVWPGTIKVHVYEKNVVGYVKYKGSNMYFDKDGIVVESSMELFNNVPQVVGLVYNTIVLNSPLDVENSDVFQDVCDLVQYLKKYGINVESVNVDDKELSVYYKDVKVIFGENNELLPDKVYEFGCLAEKLDGLKGTLYLDTFTGDGQNIIFKEE